MQLMPVSQVPGPDGRLIYSIGSVVERQKSRGRITLTSTDARTQPRIENNFCDHPDDVARLVEGVRMALRVGAHSAFDALRDRRLAPSDETVDDEEQIASWAKHVASSGFHPSCTASMGSGTDPMAVVDQRLHLRSFENLYVADASVMPKCPRANIHLTSVMIGERAGEWLREGAI
jgi:choline dehydrogenase